MSAAVYRFFDADGALLYIGSTTDLEKRLNQHLRYAPPPYPCPGWQEIRDGYSRHEVTVYALTDDARAAEKAAILAEAPLLNRRGNPTRWRPGPGKGAGGFVPVEVSA